MKISNRKTIYSLYSFAVLLASLVVLSACFLSCKNPQADLYLPDTKDAPGATNPTGNTNHTHDYTWTFAVATCTTPDTHTGTCSCGAVTAIPAGTAPGHDWDWYTYISGDNPNGRIRVCQRSFPGYSCTATAGVGDRGPTGGTIFYVAPASFKFYLAPTYPLSENLADPDKNPFVKRYYMEVAPVNETIGPWGNYCDETDHIDPNSLAVNTTPALQTQVMEYCKKYIAGWIYNPSDPFVYNHLDYYELGNAGNTKTYITPFECGNFPGFDSEAHLAAFFGLGFRDTEIIVNTMLDAGFVNSAAEICRKSGRGGVNDWFLPNIGELLTLYNSGVLPKNNTVYWSSSQRNPAAAWSYYFTTSHPHINRMASQNRDRSFNSSMTRAVRAF